MDASDSRRSEGRSDLSADLVELGLEVLFEGLGDLFSGF
jgi:hypothetical protein